MNHPLPASAADSPATPSAAWWVVCLCANWCGVCRDYRALFDTLAQAHPGARFVWVDVEDEEDVAGDLDVETFPTLLIADGQHARFLGPLLPQAPVLARLLTSLQDAPPPRAAVSAPAQAVFERVRAAQRIEPAPRAARMGRRLTATESLLFDSYLRFSHGGQRHFSLSFMQDTPWFHLSSLQPLCDSGVWQRGLALQRSGQVLEVDVDALRDLWLLQGRVQDTQRHPYSVSIELALRDDGTVDGFDSDCSCPVGQPVQARRGLARARGGGRAGRASRKCPPPSCARRCRRAPPRSSGWKPRHLCCAGSTPSTRPATRRPRALPGARRGAAEERPAQYLYLLVGRRCAAQRAAAAARSRALAPQGRGRLGQAQAHSHPARQGPGGHTTAPATPTARCCSCCVH